MRSFTLPPGLRDSSLAQTSASHARRAAAAATAGRPASSRSGRARSRATWQGSGMTRCAARSARSIYSRVRGGSIHALVADLSRRARRFPARPAGAARLRREHRRRPDDAGGRRCALRALARPERARGRDREPRRREHARGSSAATPLPAWLAGRPVVYQLARRRSRRCAIASPRPPRRRALLRRRARSRAPEHAVRGVRPALPAWARSWHGCVGAARDRAAGVARGVARPGRVAPATACSPSTAARARRRSAGPRAGSSRVAERWRRAAASVVELAGPAEAATMPLRLGAVAARDWPLPDVAALLGARRRLRRQRQRREPPRRGRRAADVAVFTADRSPHAGRRSAAAVVALDARSAGAIRLTPRPSPVASLVGRSTAAANP